MGEGAGSLELGLFLKPILPPLNLAHACALVDRRRTAAAIIGPHTKHDGVLSERVAVVALCNTACTLKQALHSSQALNSGHTSTFSVWMVESYNLLTQFAEHPSSKMCMARPRDLEPPWWCSFPSVSMQTNLKTGFKQLHTRSRVFWPLARSGVLP